MARISVEKAEDLATKFNVTAIPTFVLIKKSAGDIEIVQTVASAHVEKLKRLFESALDVKALKK